MCSYQSIRDHQAWSEDSVDGDGTTDTSDSDDSIRVHESPTQPNRTPTPSSKVKENGANAPVASTHPSGTILALTETPVDDRSTSPPPSIDGSGSRRDPSDDDGSSDSGSARTDSEPDEQIEHADPNLTSLVTEISKHDNKRTGETWMTKVITIWLQIWLNLWKLRNEDRHGRNGNTR
jgi:hypothetical protein